MRALPRGTITFLFTDIEGSTRLLEELGAEGYEAALAEHRRVLRDAFEKHGGVEVDTQGDAFFVAFPTAPGALGAAAEAQAALALPVRMGIHTGTPHVGEEGYVGMDVNRAARIAAAGHGGQVLVSASTRRSLTVTSSATSASIGSRICRRRSACTSSATTTSRRSRPCTRRTFPLPATPFLGRERDLAAVAALLQADGHRLVTLTGPGGSGKTRLALQAAGAAADAYPHGVWWVPLAPISDAAAVLDAAGRSLGASGRLAATIADRRLLLLLDNFEHVIEAAPDVGTAARRLSERRCARDESRAPAARRRARVSGSCARPARGARAVRRARTRAQAGLPAGCRGRPAVQEPR